MSPGADLATQFEQLLFMFFDLLEVGFDNSFCFLQLGLERC